MPQTCSSAEGSLYTPQRVADLLAVVMMSDMHLSNEMQIVVTSSPQVGLGALHFLEPFLLSDLPVSDARSELAQLDRSLLLAGLAIWAERQGAVVWKPAASATDSR